MLALSFQLRTAYADGILWEVLEGVHVYIVSSQGQVETGAEEGCE